MLNIEMLVKASTLSEGDTSTSKRESFMARQKAKQEDENSCLAFFTKLEDNNILR
ncbi:hypothetical protein SBF1_4640002 [Candidatus Desulfosporosinus infrequens]|uniref:Uncharacterized protein n=1 Tax=Candidatus Desulfosporosinus infrequens TaxID=2043169 RepID=A0A2U3LD95_9FIRM|nr:hypothetical protein SBF1_4640002 [Candidatus Desulfosporosinus infrequens]